VAREELPRSTGGERATAEGRAPERDRATPFYKAPLLKGLAILRLFDEKHPTWHMADLLEVLDMSSTTLYRILWTLTSEGFLELLPDGAYRPGAPALRVGSVALNEHRLVRIASPRLRQLAADTGQNPSLGVLLGDEVLYLIRLRNSDIVTTNIQVGSTVPAVMSSIGKVLLGHLTDEEIHHRIGAGPSGATPSSRSGLAVTDLAAEIREAKLTGWASHEEEADGFRSVAAPVRDGGIVVAGVNIAGRSRDWSTRRIRTALVPDLLAACEEITAQLGESDRLTGNGMPQPLPLGLPIPRASPQRSAS